ncbi:MAG: mannose-1-phosphate guanyltransferase [Candidatus Thermofonsia Clade 1 bacterium]|jgi:mannose-1-phosphate guanylyltransferase|uniref:mannose-1-phosphate guanylyltransferase n=1 Tax=Candidatus Thermofonsia Clade 1 bacterium TaxID=2364210 RepID=A0A2M8PED3_9CHLR|nr:MAG: mannose-1-phosphate guanyltransferase [Candidatus Thermofonsia Clade 1 bacterium]RMF49758.1 MAG: mannose-1-phosphate guanyltransferase [Chloroflexota bacterium]
MSENFYALIMAGGGGTRLWPLSRQDRPKQMLPLTEERTLFQVTVERLRDLLPTDHIFVVTGADMAEALHQSTPNLPFENFIVEPFGRDSGPAAALGVFRIAERDPEAVIAILSADHHIADEEAFLQALRAAVVFARQGYIVTLGIAPSYPATGFGYIERGEKLGEAHGLAVYRSLRFTEKPDEATAALFLSKGTYSWNGGMFIMTAARAKQEFARQQPAMYALLERAIAQPAELPAIWQQIQKISLDYAIMEGAQDVAVIPVQMGWSDVGTWSTLFEVLARDQDDNVVRGGDHIRIDTRSTLIVSERLVVTIGVSNLVIVDSGDVILVCDKDRAQDVREVVRQLKAQGKDAHL